MPQNGTPNRLARATSVPGLSSPSPCPHRGLGSPLPCAHRQPTDGIDSIAEALALFTGAPTERISLDRTSEEVRRLQRKRGAAGMGCRACGNVIMLIMLIMLIMPIMLVELIMLIMLGILVMLLCNPYACFICLMP